MITCEHTIKPGTHVFVCTVTASPLCGFCERDALRSRVAELERMRDAFQRDSNVTLEQRRAAERERDNARCNARILAHAYTTDNRPLARAVSESLAYPAKPWGADT